jgi:hypothetical protein
LRRPFTSSLRASWVMPGLPPESDDDAGEWPWLGLGVWRRTRMGACARRLSALLCMHSCVHSDTDTDTDAIARIDLFAGPLRFISKAGSGS